MYIGTKSPPDLGQLDGNKGSVLFGLQCLCCGSLERQGLSRFLCFTPGRNLQGRIVISEQLAVLTVWFLPLSIYVTRT